MATDTLLHINELSQMQCEVLSILVQASESATIQISSLKELFVLSTCRQGKSGLK